MNNISLNINSINGNNNTNLTESNNVNIHPLNVNTNKNAANQNTDVAGNASNKSANVSSNQSGSANSADNNTEKEKELSKQIETNLNPSPMLSQAMLFKWDASAGGAVINIVDFKTGKVLAQIPPNSVLKMMSNYQKGSLYNGKL
jgi:uncharacterized FlaG/YvyC family protein